jgi:hypothetical protein
MQEEMYVIRFYNFQILLFLPSMLSTKAVRVIFKIFVFKGAFNFGRKFSKSIAVYFPACHVGHKTLILWLQNLAGSS